MESQEVLSLIIGAVVTLAIVVGAVYWIYSVILKSPNNWIFLSVGFLATAGGCFASEEFGFVLIIAAVIFVIFIISGYNSECPNCDTWWNKSRTRSDFLGQSSHRSSRIKSEPVRDSNYQHVGYVDVKVPIEVITERYIDYYKCESCHHKWTENRSSTQEYDL